MRGNQFTQFLLNNQEKYQGITDEKYAQFFHQAKAKAQLIAKAMGLDPNVIEDITPESQLSKMLEEGEIELIGGLHWTRQAVDDALAAFEAKVNQ